MVSSPSWGKGEGLPPFFCRRGLQRRRPQPHALSWSLAAQGGGPPGCRPWRQRCHGPQPRRARAPERPAAAPLQPPDTAAAAAAAAAPAPQHPASVPAPARHPAHPRAPLRTCSYMRSKFCALGSRAVTFSTLRPLRSRLRGGGARAGVAGPTFCFLLCGCAPLFRGVERHATHAGTLPRAPCPRNRAVRAGTGAPACIRAPVVVVQADDGGHVGDEGVGVRVAAGGRLGLAAEDARHAAHEGALAAAAVRCQADDHHLQGGPGRRGCWGGAGAGTDGGRRVRPASPASGRGLVRDPASGGGARVWLLRACYMWL